MTNGLLIQPVSNESQRIPRAVPSTGETSRSAPGNGWKQWKVHWSVGLTRDLIQVNAAYVDVQYIDLKHELDVS